MPSTSNERSPDSNTTEYEEIWKRNHTICSSAISKAVADAAAGDYSPAIKTLVAAISMLKQSTFSGGERYKALIDSLQDTLHGVVSQSYTKRPRERSRSRDRSHSRDRDRERSWRACRERSRTRERSKERHYRSRDHSRSRHRHRDKSSDSDATSGKKRYDDDRDARPEREYHHRSNRERGRETGDSTQRSSYR
jgi:hypothetical protein